MASPSSVILPRFAFKRRALNPPGIPVQTGDDFVVTTWTKLLGFVYEARLHFLGPDLRYSDVRFRVQPTLTREREVFSLPLTDGFLLGAYFGPANVDPLSNPPLPPAGATWGQLAIGFGALRVEYVHTLLGAGWIDAVSLVGWPGGSNLYQFDPLGPLWALDGTTPAAGAEISEAIPLGAQWSLETFTFQLVTSAAAGNRTVRWIWGPAPSVFYQAVANFAQPPSTTRRYCVAAHGVSLGDALDTCLIPIPPGGRIGQGGTMRTITNGLAAGDQFSQVEYTFREMPAM